MPGIPGMKLPVAKPQKIQRQLKESSEKLSVTAPAKLGCSISDTERAARAERKKTLRKYIDKSFERIQESHPGAQYPPVSEFVRDAAVQPILFWATCAKVV